MNTNIKQKVLLSILALAAVFFGYLNYTSDFSSGTDTGTTTVSAQLQQVIDGDTIRVRLSTDKESATTTDVRLIGVDAPEIDWETETAECFGFEARTFLESQLDTGTVILKQDSQQTSQDEYGRLLAYVYQDGININRQLIERGYARELSVGNGYSQRPTFQAAETTARSAGRGLWLACEGE